MAQTLRGLAKKVRAKADKVEHAGSRLAVIGTLAGVEALIYMTPVDTSEHLSNWQVNLGNPAADALPPFYPGVMGSTRGASAAEALDQARQELSFKKPGQPIFISNLGPAIVKLDQGWSGQFPGGFVPRAMIVIRRAIQDATPGVLK